MWGRGRRSPEEDEPPGEDEDDDGEKRGAKTRKKKRRTRRPTADPDEVESLAEGFGTVTAVVGGTFALASLVILWKAFASSEEDLVGKPPYVWLMIQGVGATLAYTWLAVSGGGLSAGWSWAKTSINATAGFIVAISALDAFMVVAATGDSPEGAPQSTSVVFWAVMWGIYPIIALLFMNIPGLVGDVRLKGPQREEADEEEDEEPGEDEPEPEDGADEEGEAGEGDEEGEAVEDDEAPTKQITGGEFPAEEPEDEPQKES